MTACNMADHWSSLWSGIFGKRN